MVLSSVMLETAGKENKVRAKWRPPHPLPCTLHRRLFSSEEGVGMEVSGQWPQHRRGGKRGKFNASFAPSPVLPAETITWVL